MARYTIDVYTLLKDNNFKVFNFDYDFYTDDPNIKQTFETKFIDRYMFNEIGFETVSRFKHYLKERLNSIAPYYKQLYETELKSKDIEFLLNKDLKETFIREIELEKNATNDTTMSTTNDTTSSSTENSNNSLTSNTIENNDITGNETKSDNLVSDFKESNLDNGNADLSLNQGYLTNVNNKHDVTTSTSNNTLNENKENSLTSSMQDEKTSNLSTKLKSTGINNSINNENENQTETTTLISRGNIGVTSSAELLKQWREVLINIDNLIIEECRDLFMSIY